jgi:cysteine-rich repeat protein
MWCIAATCGDGHLLMGVEQCDDGNDAEFDGCELDCERSQVHSISSGNDYTCILFGAGSVRCWGANSYGQLGRPGGSIGDQPGEMPPPDLVLGGNAVQLATGTRHACALLENNRVVCWGHNGSGQLGIGNTENIGDEPNEMPPQQIAGLGNVVQLVAASSSTCVLLDTGGVRCWGSSQAGYNTSVNYGDDPGEMPTPLVSVGGTVAELAAHGSFNCARLVNTQVRCWGSNDSGQCGQGHENTIGNMVGSMPPPAINYGGGVIAGMHPGLWNMCLSFDDGDLRCWGRNTSGQLGLNHNDDIADQPNEMPPINSIVGGLTSFASGGLRHTCAIITGGTVRCWGNNDYGQLGYQVASNVGDNLNEMPSSNALLPIGAVALATGEDHTCALYADNSIRCWGYNSAGRLGNGSVVSTSSDWGSMPPDPIDVF